MAVAVLLRVDAVLDAYTPTSVLLALERDLELRLVDRLDRLERALAVPGDIAWLLIDLDGLGNTAEVVIGGLRARLPDAGCIAIGTAACAAEVDRAMALGVAAYLPRSFNREAMAGVFGLVRAGERFRPLVDAHADELRREVTDTWDPVHPLRQFGLTKAEHDVLVLMAHGKTNPEIAVLLGKEEGTVRVQVTAILRKLSVRNRAEAILVAMRDQSVIEAQQERARSGPLDLGWLHPHMEHRRHRAGDVLFREGDMGSEMYVVQRGCVRLPQLGIEMRENDMFGEIAIFAPNHRRTSTAVCATDADLFVLGEDKVRRIQFLNPSFALIVLQLITKRLMADRQRAH